MINSEAEYNQMLSDNAEYEYYNWQREMNTIKIGSQEWATEDLKVSKFRNGEDIPFVTDNEEWAKLTTAGYCITPKGNYLYNWYAVNDARGLCPTGFHVPTDEEWTVLENFLGGSSVAGAKMKSSPSDIPAWDGTNSSGFFALPGGFRYYYNGFFHIEGYFGNWWSSSANGTLNAWGRDLLSVSDYVYRNYYNQRNGFSVRCLKNKREMKTPMQEMLEWVRATLPMDLDWPMLIEQKAESLLEKEKEVAQQYAEFAIECDREKLPVLEFDEWINL